MAAVMAGFPLNFRQQHQWSGFDVRYPTNRAPASERQIQGSTGINIFKWSFDSGIRRSARGNEVRMPESDHLQSVGASSRS
jgi:hypothetical protein